MKSQIPVYYVDKNLKVRAQLPNSGYQYRGSREACEEYVSLAKTKYTEAEKQANEDAWLQGRNFKESPRSASWRAKKRKHDENRRARRKNQE